jgi:hypothetical protein
VVKRRNRKRHKKTFQLDLVQLVMNLFEIPVGSVVDASVKLLQLAAPPCKSLAVQIQDCGDASQKDADLARGAVAGNVVQVRELPQHI